MIEIIANSKHKKSLLELEKIENILNREKIEYKVLKTSKKEFRSSNRNSIFAFLNITCR